MDASPSVATEADSSIDELTALRKRAYGPDADILRDPRALRRLTELESADRRTRAVPPVRPAPAGPHQTAPANAADPEGARDESTAPSGQGRSAAVADRARPSERVDDPASRVGADPSPSGTPGTPWRRVRGGVLALSRKWWAVAAASVVLTALALWGLQAATDRPDALLAPIASTPAEREAVDVPGSLAGYRVDDAELQRYESYGRLRVWSGESADGRRCLLLETERYGVFNAGCVPVGLDPVVDFTVYEGMPAALRGDLPVGSVVRFVLVGTQVEVSAATATTTA
ncbi:hypothetical protein [Microbacterium sp. P02]|uniref:hypothetical protein n=1 Tax=Microbacterium sp. P02 TaxID=3366260 RepID=UPI003670F743